MSADARHLLWHPLSVVCMNGTYAAPNVLKMFAGRRPVPVQYFGDRMWPTLAHGEEVRISGLDQLPRPGELVVVDRGAVDISRVESVDETGIWCCADADPSPAEFVALDRVIGVIDRPLRPDSARRRVRRRAWLDLKECASPALAEEGGNTVRAKYDDQAGSYARYARDGTELRIAGKVAQSLQPNALILVVGCGAGRECRDLWARGHRVVGLDFSWPMCRHAKEISETTFSVVHGDIRATPIRDDSVDATVFTPDVYSFLPRREMRVQVLRDLARLARSGSSLWLSARLFERVWPRALLGLRRLLGRVDQAGDSHARWVDPSGRIHRSYVHLFRPRQLESEIREAGWTIGERSNSNEGSVYWRLTNLRSA